MSVRAFFLAIALVLGLAACGKPVPPEKAAYVGEWQRPEMYLLITQDGSVRYKRLKGGGTVEVNGPLQGFEGDDFSVGVGAMSTRFKVNKPPRQVEGAWKMTVDGVELTRTSE